MDWKTEAKQLSIGGQTRIQCCGSSKAALISRDVSGISLYCFRCGAKGYESLEAYVPLSYKPDTTPLKLEIPEDLTADMPHEAAKWVYAFGLTGDRMQKASIGYSPSMKRIVIPVYENGILVQIQYRAVFMGQQPKYLNVGKPETKPLYFTEDNGQLLKPGPRIVTEDIMSALKIARVYPAVALMGTSLNAQQGARLVRRGQEVIVWLDGDLAGRNASVRVSKELLMQGANVTSVKTELDPKYLTTETIIKTVEERNDA